MKKTISIILVIILFTVYICGCDASTEKSDKLKIVTTYFSAYDWTRNILGEKLEDTELILISDNGVDMHSYEPTAKDIIDIKTADIIIYNGSSSDKWIDDTLKDDKIDNKIINSVSVLKDKLLYVGESHHNHKDHSHNQSTADEHIWLSLKNAIVLCDEIKNCLLTVDSENGDLYIKNLKIYTEKLSELDENYSNKFGALKNNTLIFADRFPFAYTMFDYSLKYHALFEGCTAESAITANALVELSSIIDSSKAKYVFIIDKTALKTAKSAIENSNCKDTEILILNSMQTVTKEKLKDADYIKIMENNLALMYKSALN